MTQPENNDGNSAVQLTHVTRNYKRDKFEVCARWMVCRTKMGLGYPLPVLQFSDIKFS